MAVAIASGFPKAAISRSAQAVSPSYVVAANQIIYALCAGNPSAGGPDPVLSEVTVTGGTITWTKILRYSAATGTQTVAIYKGVPSAALTGVTTKCYTGTASSYIAIFVVDGSSGNIGATIQGPTVTNTSPSTSISAIAAGSLILTVGFNNAGDVSGAITAGANCTMLDGAHNDGVDTQAWVQRVTALTSGAGAQAINSNVPASNSGIWASVEILGQVGSGIATIIGVSSASASGKGLHKSTTAGPTLAGLGVISASSFRQVALGGQVIRPDEMGVQDPRWGDSLQGVKGGVQITPPSGRLDVGWINGDQPPEGFMNWWQYGVWKWVQWLKSLGNPIVQLGHFSAPVPTAIGRYSLWPANSEAVPSSVAAGQTGPKRGIIIPRACYVDTLIAYVDPATPISGAGSVDLEVWMVDGSARKIGTWTYSVASGITSGMSAKIKKKILTGDGIAQNLGAYLVCEANVTGVLPQISFVKILARICGQDTLVLQP